MTRPVIIFEYEKHPSGVYKNPLIKLEKNVGLFHKFGNDYEEFENGPGNFSIAIIELLNGEIVSVPVELIQFTDKINEVNNEHTKLAK